MGEPKIKMMPILERIEFIINDGELIIDIMRNNQMQRMTYEDFMEKQKYIEMVEKRNKMLIQLIKFSHHCSDSKHIVYATKLETLIKIAEKQIISEKRKIKDRYSIEI